MHEARARGLLASGWPFTRIDMQQVRFGFVLRWPIWSKKREKITGKILSGKQGVRT
jgi:hypothetical protein